jgi:hypothetical protein
VDVVGVQATLGQQLFDITVRGVRGVTEQRKQLSVVTDGSEGVYRPTIVLGSPTTASEEGRHTMRAILTLQMNRT